MTELIVLLLLLGVEWEHVPREPTPWWEVELAFIVGLITLWITLRLTSKPKYNDPTEKIAKYLQCLDTKTPK